jgi:hypothetical protein
MSQVLGIHARTDTTINPIFKGERFTTSVQLTALPLCDAVSITKILSVDVTGNEGGREN